MREKSNSLPQYFSLLFSDWLNIVSNAITVTSLLLGFLNVNWLPSLFSSIPREVYIGLAFLAFGWSNYRVYRKSTPENSSFDFEIKGVEGVGVNSELIVRTSQDLFIAPEIKFQIAVRLFVTNIGNQTAVNFTFVSLSPIPNETIKSLTVKLTNIGSGGIKVDNPYYFKTDEMSGNFQVVVNFSLDTEILEKIYGSLGGVEKTVLTLGATPTGRRAIHRSVEIDLSNAIKHTLEDRIPNLAVQSLPLSIKAFKLMRRYWLGPKGEASL